MIHTLIPGHDKTWCGLKAETHHEHDPILATCVECLKISAKHNKPLRFKNPATYVREEEIMEYYYYTRWTFKQTPDGLDDCGPYHAATISNRPPSEFMKDNQWDNLKDFFYVSFSSKEEMENYYALFVDFCSPT